MWKYPGFSYLMTKLSGHIICVLCTAFGLRLSSCFPLSIPKAQVKMNYLPCGAVVQTPSSCWPCSCNRSMDRKHTHTHTHPHTHTHACTHARTHAHTHTHTHTETHTHTHTHTQTNRQTDRELLFDVIWGNAHEPHTLGVQWNDIGHWYEQTYTTLLWARLWMCVCVLLRRLLF